MPFRKTQREGLMRWRPNRPLQQTPAQDVKGHVVEAVTRSFFPNADLVANFDSATGGGSVEVTYNGEPAEFRPICRRWFS